MTRSEVAKLLFVFALCTFGGCEEAMTVQQMDEAVSQCRAAGLQVEYERAAFTRRVTHVYCIAP